MMSFRNRLTRYAVFVSLASLMITVVGLMTSADPAVAKSSFLGDFNSRYGTAGTALDSCSLCHTNVPSLNPYGTDWKNNNKNFGAIESRDSDGDGWGNLQEIQARTMPGDAASKPPPTTTTTTTTPPTTTTRPPGTTTTPPTTTSPPTTTTPPTTLPPPGNGPLVLTVTEFTAPASVNVSNGNQPRSINVKARVRNAPADDDVTAQIRLYRNGTLEQTISRTREAQDNGEVEYEVAFNFTFTTAHVPQVEWWAIIAVGNQNSSAATRTTTVIGPPPPTTTTQPPTTTTQPPTTTTQPPTTTTQPPGGIDGAAIYAASCAGCHGTSGEGGFGGPVAGTSMNLDQVIAITKGGQGGMPGFSNQLSGAEIRAVSRYVLDFDSGQPPVPTTTTTLPPGTPPGSGSALYRQHCSGCHGVDADSGIGGSLVRTSLSFAQQVSVTSHGRGTMPGFSNVLSANEIDSIIRYIAGLGVPGSTTTTVAPGTESGAAIYGRLCAACHGSDGSGGVGGAIAATDYSGTALAGVITAGVGTMPGFGSELDDDQLSRLVAYVEGLSGGGDPSGGSTTIAGAAGTDPQEGFTGHASQSEPDTGQSAAAPTPGAGAISPLPVGSPLGWSLALSIAAAMIAVGSAVTGAMPKDAEPADG